MIKGQPSLEHMTVLRDEMRQSNAEKASKNVLVVGGVPFSILFQLYLFSRERNFKFCKMKHQGYRIN
jgi:hypothetical protein